MRTSCLIERVIETKNNSEFCSEPVKEITKSIGKKKGFVTRKEMRFRPGDFGSQTGFNILEMEKPILTECSEKDPRGATWGMIERVRH